MVNVLDAYGHHLRLKDCSDSTVKNYTRLVGTFVRWWEKVADEPFDLPAVTPADVADFKRHLLDRGRRPATVNLCVEALRSFFSWAVAEGLCESNPAGDVRRVREQNAACRWLSRKEMGSLARAVQKYGGPRDRAILGLLLHAGLRVSELVGLKTADIVLRERSGFVKVWGKGTKYREVPLNITARKMLQEWLAAHPGGEWLFPGRNGSPVTARAVQIRLKELGRLARVEVTPHRLRHTFCKMLVDAGESLDRVAMLAGHANLNTTARYTRPGVWDLERAVEKLAWE